MENIFENAYFGKPYKTREGKKALYLNFKDDAHWLDVDGTYPLAYNSTGYYFPDCSESDLDIISEWHEEINEEELENSQTKNHCG